MAVPNVYSPLSVPAMFMIQRRQRLLRGVLARAFPQGVGDVSLLEIGCGNGQWLAEFVALGFAPGKLHGVELSAVRAAEAAARLPGVDARQGDASSLPWADGAFDIVFQSTVFTSIPDPTAKRRVAAEMRRVCRPGGLVVWYDFAFDSPNNPEVKGVKAREVRELFAPWKARVWKVTLAPPIARRLAPLSWTAAELLETCCPFLRTHLLAAISDGA